MVKYPLVVNLINNKFKKELGWSSQLYIQSLKTVLLNILGG